MPPSVVSRPKTTKSRPRPLVADEGPLYHLDELDESSGPPIPGKVNPRAAMDDVVPTLDDSDRPYRHHPNESGSEALTFDPENADAAADLAAELGADFLEGATRGRNMSDVILSEEADAMNETSFILEPADDGDESNEELDEEPVEVEKPRYEVRPKPPIKRAAHKAR